MVSYWQIFLVFAKIGAFTIGGGIPMIAAIKSELVEREWLKDEDFFDIITIAQSTPGLFAVNISILTGYKLRGTKGSIIATIASCLPSFLIILLVALIMSIIGFPISATTTGRIPLNARITYSLSLKFVKNMATRRIIRNGGRQLAIVAIMLPFVPRSL